MKLAASAIGRTVRTGLDLMLPRPCPGCGGPEPWCAGCAGTLQGRPRLLALPESTLDAATGFRLPPARALTRYAGPARAAILAGKEHGRTDLPPLLGLAVGLALLRLQRSALVSAEIWIVPAPSRRSAARRRGGDPVIGMANAAARALAERGTAAGVAPCLYTAGRARDSVGLDAAGRLANLNGRVRFQKSGAPPSGASVVLLDDVLTSGATMVASCRVLATAGLEVDMELAIATAAPWCSERGR